MFKSNLKTIVFYSIFVLILTGLLFLFSFIKIYECGMIFGISSIFSIFYLLVNLEFGKCSNDLKSSKKKIIIMSILRYILIILMVVVPAIAIYFTPDLCEIGKYRFLFILLAGIPILFASLFFYIRAKKAEKE